MEKEPKKKSYRSPIIFDHGNVADITKKITSGPKMDGGVKKVDPGMKTSV